MDFAACQHAPQFFLDGGITTFENDGSLSLENTLGDFDTVHCYIPPASIYVSIIRPTFQYVNT